MINKKYKNVKVISDSKPHLLSVTSIMDNRYYIKNIKNEIQKHGNIALHMKVLSYFQHDQSSCWKCEQWICRYFGKESYNERSCQYLFSTK